MGDNHVACHARGNQNLRLYCRPPRHSGHARQSAPGPPLPHILSCLGSRFIISKESEVAFICSETRLEDEVHRRLGGASEAAEAGFDVCTTANGYRAPAQVKAQRPELILAICFCRA